MNAKISIKYSFGVVMILAGIIFNNFDIGSQYFSGFATLGNWMIYVGFISLAIIALQNISNRKRIVDERMIQIANKSGRVTFVAVILFAFITMIIDGIKPISVAYHMFMAYLVCFMILTYFISYKLIEVRL